MHTRRQLADQLRALGLAPGDIVMVHASMRAVGPLLGGPNAIIHALLDVVGRDGTIAAYVDWENAAQGYLSGSSVGSRGSLPPELLEQLPPFDPASARACRAHGVFAEFLRTWGGARRSGNLGASVAAVGGRAEWLCADHPLSYGYGPGSPFAKLVEAGGRVLLLGSDPGNVTLLHHVEHVARLPNKRVIRYREPLLIEGAARWFDIEEFDTARPVVPEAPDDYFDTLIGGYLAAGRASTGQVGAARTHLIGARDLHVFAVAWMETRWGEASGAR